MLKQPLAGFEFTSRSTDGHYLITKRKKVDRKTIECIYTYNFFIIKYITFL